MPSYKVHIPAGFITFILLYIIQQKLGVAPNTFQNVAAILLSSTVGSIFPDIDTTSIMQRLFFLSILVIAPVFIFQNNYLMLAITAAVCIIILIIPHRSITHKPKWVIPFAALVCGALALIKHIDSMLLWQCWLYFIAAFLSHWLLDRYF